MTIKSKFVSIEKNTGDIDLCFWTDKEKTELESFRTEKSQEEAEASLEYWTSERKTFKKA
tara:strand:+ start:320 stop:499 length:180 start_codon:yes stop_codon:yes gene_type:complete